MTLSVLSIVVLIPLASLVVYTANLSPAEFWETITKPLCAGKFSGEPADGVCRFCDQCGNGRDSGVVLVRYRFPMKRLLTV